MSFELARALLRSGAVSDEALTEAIGTSLVDRIPLIRALLATGALQPERLDAELARGEVPKVSSLLPDFAAVARLPADLCQRLLAVPLGRDRSTDAMLVAVADPFSEHASMEIARCLGTRTRQVQASLSDIDLALSMLTWAQSPSLLPEAADSDGNRPTEPAPPPSISNIALAKQHLETAMDRDDLIDRLMGACHALAERVCVFVVKRDAVVGHACLLGDSSRFKGLTISRAEIASGFLARALSDDQVHVGDTPRVLDPFVGTSGEAMAVTARVEGRAVLLVVVGGIDDPQRAREELETLSIAAGEGLASLLRMRRPSTLTPAG